MHLFLWSKRWTGISDTLLKTSWTDRNKTRYRYIRTLKSTHKDRWNGIKNIISIRWQCKIIFLKPEPVVLGCRNVDANCRFIEILFNVTECVSVYKHTPYHISQIYHMSYISLHIVNFPLRKKERQIEKKLLSLFHTLISGEKNDKKLGYFREVAIYVTYDSLVSSLCTVILNYTTP